jgi:hypothetical protein
MKPNLPLYQTMGRFFGFTSLRAGQRETRVVPCRWTYFSPNPPEFFKPP